MCNHKLYTGAAGTEPRRANPQGLLFKRLNELMPHPTLSLYDKSPQQEMQLHQRRETGEQEFLSWLA